MKSAKFISACLIVAAITTSATTASAQNKITREQATTTSKPAIVYKPKSRPKGWTNVNTYVAPRVPQYDIIEYNPQLGGKLTNCCIGDNYFWGENGKTQDYTMAAFYYQLGADEGDPAAQVNLGICYENGYGVEKDKVSAAFWYYQAACEEVPTAEFNMGNCYANGWGVEIDYDEAIAWYRRAEQHGHPKAAKKIERILRNR